MEWSDISFHPAPKVLRQFAGIWIGVVSGLACWQALGRGHPATGLILEMLAVGVGVLGLVWPEAMRWLYVGGMVLGFPIGWVMSKILLGLVFFGLFTPLAVVFRLVGRDSLARRKRSAVETYWLPRRSAPEPRQYFHQF